MARIREGCGISCPDWHAWERDLKKAATRQEMPISDEDLDRFRHALADVHVKSSDQQRMEVEYRLQRFGAKMWRRILARLDAAEATLSPGDHPSERGQGWTHVKTPPKVGGSYVIGGYVTGPLGRGFERTFGYVFLTVDGPEWRHCDPAKADIPIEYWFGLPCHPERTDHLPSGEAAGREKPGPSQCSVCETYGVDHPGACDDEGSLAAGGEGR